MKRIILIITFTRPGRCVHEMRSAHLVLHVAGEEKWGESSLRYTVSKSQGLLLEQHGITKVAPLTQHMGFFEYKEASASINNAHIDKVIDDYTFSNHHRNLYPRAASGLVRSPVSSPVLGRTFRLDPFSCYVKEHLTQRAHIACLNEIWYIYYPAARNWGSISFSTTLKRLESTLCFWRHKL